MDDLKNGWAYVPLSELCQFNPKHDPSIPDSTLVSFVPMPAVDEHTGTIADLAQKRPLRDVWKGYTHFREGDVLFAKITPCMENGKSAVAQGLENELACGSTEFHVLRALGAVLPTYLWRFLRQRSYRWHAETSMTGAVGQRRVPRQFLETTELPLPPVAEQKRIVAKLDALSEKSARARAELARIETLVTRYKQAVLAKAFSGKLDNSDNSSNGARISATIEYPFRYTQTAPEHWSKFVFSDVCKIVGGSQPAKEHFRYEPQEGLIRLIQIRDYKSDAKATYIPRDLARRHCSKDDIMIGRYGPPVFQILRGLEGAYNVALMKAEPSRAVCREFLYWYLQHPILFRYVEIDSKRTAGQDGVNKAHLERWPILLPPIDEQKLIVSSIEFAFAKIDRIAAEAKRALELVGKLDEAILAKAFRGELVPQDPNDEPASVLLDRIRAEREAAPKPKSRARAKKSAKTD